MMVILTRIYNKIKDLYNYISININLALVNIQNTLFNGFSNLGAAISQSDYQIQMHQELKFTKVFSGACFLDDKSPLSNFIANQDNVNYFEERGDTIIPLNKNRTPGFKFADFNHLNIAIDNTDGSRVVIVKVFGYSLQDHSYNCLYTFLCPASTCINQTIDINIPITLNWNRDDRQFGFIEISGTTNTFVYCTTNYYPFPLSI